jgi:hypothetical protein
MWLVSKRVAVSGWGDDDPSLIAPDAAQFRARDEGFGATGVAGVAATCVKSLELQSLRQLRAKIDKVENEEFRGSLRQEMTGCAGGAPPHDQ